MFILESYPVAVFFCLITMLCWGSWANTQKLAEKSWRFELFYWDYVIGILIMSLLFAFTLGSTGENGKKFFGRPVLRPRHQVFARQLSAESFSTWQTSC